MTTTFQSAPPAKADKSAEYSLAYVHVNGQLLGATMDGRVFRLNGKEAAYIDNGLGYKRIKSGQKGIMVHRVVWEAWNGPVAIGMQVDHINGNKSDNRLCNLQLVSPSQNTARYHAARRSAGKPHHTKGRKALGRNAANAIRNLAASGVPRMTIANAFGVTRSAVRHIINNVSYRTNVSERTSS